MSVFQKIRDRFNNQNKIYCIMPDDITHTILYYEITTEKGKGAVSCRVVDSIPSHAYCLNFNDLDSFHLRDLVNGTMMDYFYSLSSGVSFFDEELYQLPFEEWAKKNVDHYQIYVDTLKKTKEKCITNGVLISDDTNEIIKRTVDLINQNEKKKNQKYEEFVVTKQIAIDQIDQELNETIESKKYDDAKFEYYYRMIINYIASFWQDYPIFSSILIKETLTENDKAVLSRYYDFMMGMPKLLDVSRRLEKCAEIVSVEKRKNHDHKYKSDPMFLSSIDGLLAKSDSSKEDLYLHVTRDLKSSKSIFDQGLYTFGDVDTFGYPLESVDQILQYEYGDSLNKYESCVIVFRLPKGSEKPSDISEEEAKEAMAIQMRRSSLVVEPTGKIPSCDILGVIDKKNMEVIENPNFNRFTDEIKK